MKSMRVLFCVMIALFMVSAVQAATCAWTADEHGIPAGGEAMWTNENYWWTNAEGGMPTGGPDGDFLVLFDHSTLVTCILDEARSVNQIKIAEGGAGHLKIVTGGSLITAENQWNGVGFGNAGVGTLEVDGGSFTTVGDGGHLWIGGTSTGGAVGNIIVRGSGVMTIGQGGGGAQFGLGWDGGTGNALIEDGLLWIANWADQSITNGSNMNITGGTVRIRGYRLDDIYTKVGDGRITGYGYADLDHVIVEWDAAAEETVITAIPEPATMTLLGLGGLALLRRKK